MIQFLFKRKAIKNKNNLKGGIFQKKQWITSTFKNKTWLQNFSRQLR